jgi:N-acetylmuramoyl-L-alanine amidase
MLLISAGHWYNTVGKTSPPSTRKFCSWDGKRKIYINQGDRVKEHMFTTGVAYAFEKELAARKFTDIKKLAYITSDNWRKDILPPAVTDDIRYRQAFVRQSGSTESIDIHADLTGDGKFQTRISGIRTIIAKDATRVQYSKKLAEIVHTEIVKAIPWQTNLGISCDEDISGKKLGMCNATYMKTKASIVIEFCYYDNQLEFEQIFCNPEAWQKYAVRLADGYQNYIK